jgi:protein SCO1/2
MRYNVYGVEGRPLYKLEGFGMRRILLIIPLLALLLAGCGPFAAQQPHEDHGDHAATDPMASGTVLNPPTQLADFSMPSTLGRPVGTADLKGKPTLIFFGFTHCPDVCPTTMAEFKRAKDDLGADGEKVNFLLISVDPERDTPEALAKYVQAFDPAFVGLQGQEPELRKIARDFGLFWEKQPPAADGSYNVDHSTAVYLLNPAGELSTVYSNSVPYTTYVKDLKAMLEG